MAPANEDPEQVEPFDFGDSIDKPTFEQILEMDAPDDREFSQSIVYDFFAQAEQTFGEMEGALEEKNLLKLSTQGHFLKGSSATLGFTKIKDECEKIQNYGKNMDETGSIDEPDDEKCLRLCDVAIKEAKKGFKVVEAVMKSYYADSRYDTNH